MKKATKKIFALLMTVAMILTMAVSVFADGAADTTTDATKATLTINKSTNSPDATYVAYKVMSATSLGNNLYAYTVEDGFKSFFTTSDKFVLDGNNQIIKKGTTDLVATDLSSTNNTDVASLARELEMWAIANESGNIDEIPVIAGQGKELPIGYYVVREKTTAADNGAVATLPVLVNLTGNKSITPKDNKTTLEKKILEGGKKLDANSANIGDDIDYEVTTSIPTYEANVDSSKLQFKLTDTFSAGLTYNKNLVITAGDATLVAGTDYTMTKNENNEFVAELTADAILKYQGCSLTLNYSAKLNEKAVVGTVGNPNHIKLEYTNNPNQENHTGTLEDEVKTFTYGFKIHKVDKNNETQDMSGAKFGIYAANADGEIDLSQELGTFTYSKDGAITESTGKVVIQGTDTQNYAAIKGLKEGSYYIKELVAPNGYSILANPIKVTITDEKNSDGDLTGVGLLEITGNTSTDIAEIEKGKSDGGNAIDLVVKIKNVKGISLPETGSKTAMYCLYGGALLIILGGLYFGIEKLVVNKKH